MNNSIIPRFEDLPYWTSPPIQFVYESTANLYLGRYIWTDNPSALTPLRPIIDNALYLFRNITLAADVEELDFTSNISDSPKFSTYLISRSNAVLFREPIIMNMFYQQFEYKISWQSSRRDDRLLAAFSGTIIQGSNLIGKNNITLKAVISAQEVVDRDYINNFKKPYISMGNV